MGNGISLSSFIPSPLLPPSPWYVLLKEEMQSIVLSDRKVYLTQEDVLEFSYFEHCIPDLLVGDLCIVNGDGDKSKVVWKSSVGEIPAVILENGRSYVYNDPPFRSSRSKSYPIDTIIDTRQERETKIMRRIDKLEIGDLIVSEWNRSCPCRIKPAYNNWDERTKEEKEKEELISLCYQENSLVEGYVAKIVDKKTIGGERICLAIDLLCACKETFYRTVCVVDGAKNIRILSEKKIE